MSEIIDVAIIGGGPAGLTAAMYAARGKVKAVIFEKGVMGGQITTTDRVDNYPGFPESISGAELGELMHQQALKFDAEEMPFVDITSLKVNDDGTFELGADPEPFVAKSVILATGSVPSKLDIPGEAEFTGRGVSWCATCDGPFYRDKTVAVIGGGDAALEEGMFLTRFASKVYIIHRRDEFRATETIIEEAKKNEKVELLTPYIPVEIKGTDDKVSGIVLEHAEDGTKKEIEVQGVFEFVGVNPQNVLAYDLLERDARGYIVTNPDSSTAIPGLFAAGDIAGGPLRQIVTACGEGAEAGFAVLQYLKERGKTAEAGGEGKPAAKKAAQ